MIINFRQGIVSYPSSGGAQQFLVPAGRYVSLSTTNGVTDVAFAHKQSNYLLTEATSVSNAWGPFTDPYPVWLYWDINNLTGARTFGFTDIEPIFQPSAPASPEVDQHWFDTGYNVMKVWNGARWQEKIRVFAAEYNPGSATFISVSVLSTSGRFDGTQVGIQGEQVNVGRIIVDNTGRPITKSNNQFFTTEDDFFVNGSPINTIRLEANVLTASPIENIAGYQVVKFVDFGRTALASYHDLQNSAIAIAMQGVQRDDVGTFVVQGTITNPEWNWPVVGAPLWVSTGGQLTETDPHTTDVVVFNIAKAPVARVIGRHTIIFDQGLGGKGEKGDSALAGGGVGEAATQFELGKVKLTATPTDPGSPYAVETNDPRLSDPRLPLPHTHTAEDVIPAPFGANITGTVQSSLQNLESAKVGRAGDTMTGPLLLSGNPTHDLAAAPKQYVDLFVEKSQRGAANGVATLDATGKITISQLPPMAISNTFVVSSQTEMLSLTAQTGDLAVRTDQGITYVLRGSNPTLIGDWQELLTRPDGVVWINVTPAAGQQGIVTTGGPVTSSGTISLSLANDLAALENISGTGVAHRIGIDTWDVRPVDLNAGSGIVVGVLPMGNGGTGLSSVSGYLKGNGTTYSVLNQIPGSDISGTVPAASSVAWTGITGRPTTISGYGITDAYTRVQTDALTWNWSAITNRPTSYIGYGITDIYSKTEVDTFLATKANVATTLAGYGITDAAPLAHNHRLELLEDVNTSVKNVGDVLHWNGTNWSALGLDNAALPTVISGKTFDDTNTTTVRDANFTVVDALDVTKRFKFEAGNITSGSTITYNMPNSIGTIALTNGFGAFGNWNINAASANTVPWAGITGRPTTLAGYGITDAYTQTQVNALTWNWSAIINRPTTLAGYGITDAYTQAQTQALTWNWSAITNRPTTLAGYGIINAYTKAEVDAKTWNWSAITNTPTTLAGYGITDAAPLVHNHDGVYLKPVDIGVTVAGLDMTGKVPAVQLPDYVRTRTFTVTTQAEMLGLSATRGDIVIRSDLSSTFILVNEDPTNIANWAQIIFPQGGNGTVTSVNVTTTSPGLAISGGPITTAGSISLSLAGDLAAVENLSTTGYVVRTAANTWGTVNDIPVAQITGVLTIAQGGTGASTAPAALSNLGGVPLNGTGATGTWDISILGNASTVTNGVYTNGSYADPIWITSLHPNKVVATWNGSTNLNQVDSEVTFGDVTVVRNGKFTHNSNLPIMVDSFAIAQFAAGKYLVNVRNFGSEDTCLAELYAAYDDAGNVYLTHTSVGTAFVQWSALYNSTLAQVEIYAETTITTPFTADTTFKYNATLFMNDII